MLHARATTPRKEMDRRAGDDEREGDRSRRRRLHERVDHNATTATANISAATGQVAAPTMARAIMQWPAGSMPPGFSRCSPKTMAGPPRLGANQRQLRPAS